MSEDPRLALAERGLDAFNARDMDAFLGLLHPEVVSRVVSPLPNAGEWRGHDGFLEMIRAWDEAWGEITYETLGQEIVDARVILMSVHQEARGVGSGVPVTLDVYYVLEFEGEHVVRLEIHHDRASALAALE